MRVLIAEDDPLIALGLAERLRSLGHEPLGPACDGEQAVALAKSAMGRADPTRSARLTAVMAAFFAPKAASASLAQVEKKSFCDMDAGYSMWKSA